MFSTFDGNTALHLAAYENHQNIIDYLLAQPGQVILRNLKGELPKCQLANVHFNWGHDLLVFSGKSKEIKRWQQKHYPYDIDFNFTDTEKRETETSGRLAPLKM